MDTLKKKQGNSFRLSSVSGEETQSLLEGDSSSVFVPKVSWRTKILEYLERIPPIHPLSRLRAAWLFIVFLFIVWNCFTIPLRITFRQLWHEDQLPFALVDCLGDFIYLIDIFVSFRTAIISSGTIETDSKIMAKKYMSYMFWIDLVSLAPIDFLSWTLPNHALLRLPRMLRFIKIPKYFEVWEVSSRSPNLLMLSKLAGGVFLISHWFSCLYIALAYQEGFGTTNFLPPDEMNFARLYVFALLWGVKVVTKVGGQPESPETEIEIAFCLFLAFLVTWIVAALIGSLVDLVASANAQSEEFRTKMSHINLFMKNKRLPPDLTQRIHNYYGHLYSRSGGFDDAQIMKEFPPHLRTEISEEMNGKALAKVPFFQDSNPGFIRSLCQNLHPEIYAPNETIIHEGDAGNEMYFISRGEVEISIGGMKVGSMGKDSFFGEISLLIQAKRTASVTATQYCDLFVLRKRHLEKVLKAYPGEKARLLAFAEQRICGDSLREVVHHDALFHSMPPETKQQFCTAFQPMTVDRGQFIYHKGQLADRMFFLGIGKLEIIGSNGKVLRTVSTSATVENMEGCFFGHLEFFLGRMREYSVRTASRCTLSFLTSEQYFSLMKQLPEQRTSIEDVARRRAKMGEVISVHQKTTLQGEATKQKLVHSQTSLSLSSRHEVFEPSDCLKQLTQLEEKIPSIEQNMDEEHLLQAVNLLNQIHFKLLSTSKK